MRKLLKFGHVFLKQNFAAIRKAHSAINSRTQNSGWLLISLAFVALFLASGSFITKPIASSPIAQNTSLFALPPQPQGVPYPTKEWQYAKIDPKKLAQLESVAETGFDHSIPALGQTRAVIVIKGSKIIYEKYAPGITKDTRLISWSMAKSFTSALFAIAEKQGKIKRTDTLNNPFWSKEDARNKITFDQALRMTDGINWREENYGDPINNDAAIMLFGKGRENIAKYVSSRPKKHEAGTVWNYSSGTTNLIAAAISQRLGPRESNDPTGKIALRNFMFNELFKPIGMSQTSPEFDANGNFYGSSLIYATAQDYARFGLLFLRGGKWEDKQIIDSEFIDYVRTPTNAKNATHYGAHWWLSPSNKTGLLRDGPYDSFEAHGHEGQVIMVIPSKDLVIVRLGISNDDKAWDAIGAYLQKIVNAI